MWASTPTHIVVAYSNHSLVGCVYADQTAGMSDTEDFGFCRNAPDIRCRAFPTRTLAAELLCLFLFAAVDSFPKTVKIYCTESSVIKTVAGSAFFAPDHTTVVGSQISFKANLMHSLYNIIHIDARCPCP